MILTSGLSYRPCWIIQKSQKCLFEWSKEPKKCFLAIFLSYVHRIDLKLHILIILNDLDKWAFISPMLDHPEVTKMPFWMIQRAKKVFFGHFLEFGASDWFQIAYFDYTKWYWHVGCHIAHAGSFKNQKNAFLDDPKCQKRVKFSLPNWPTYWQIAGEE